ncbi:MAG: flagellar motor protein MotB [Planctomycetaceae bacterium]|nr:flagellar motor protein MotB [Planctomycetaceae bacterium]
MAKRKKIEPSGANNGYLISFGDTMTALLAFFIVLNSLATEQTGAKLHDGTGSFVQAGKSHGMPGMFSSGQSRFPMSMQESSPIYAVGDDSTEAKATGSGPDDDADTIWVRDRTMEEYDRFLLAMERISKASPDQEIKGEVAFDRMKALPSPEEPLDEAMREQLMQILPLLLTGRYELDVVVWATTPSDSAWRRAAGQAQEIRTRVLEFMQLQGEDAARVRSCARPWFSSTIKRPSMSLQVRMIAGE